MANLIDITSAFLNKLDNLTDPTISARVEALISASSTYIEKYCNRVFAATAYQEYLDGGGINSIFIKNPPIVTLTQILFIASDTTTVDDSEFSYNPETGEIWWNLYNSNTSDYRGTFFKGRRNIRVDYTGGFSNIPPPIQYVCAELVIESFDITASQNAMEAIKLGQFFMSFGENVAEKVMMNNKKILGMYRLHEA